MSLNKKSLTHKRKVLESKSGHKTICGAQELNEKNEIEVGE